VKGLNRIGDEDDLPLFASPRPARPLDADLPSLRIGEEVMEDYRSLGLTLRSHPVALLRSRLQERGASEAARLAETRSGRAVRVAGLVLIRQRPGTASGIIFMTLEDETDVANIVIRPPIFERFRAETLGSRLCAVDGFLQNERGVIHVIARRLHDWSGLLAGLSARPAQTGRSQGDEARRPIEERGREEAIPRGRNFR
jgi:error-prone DNA polymerase